MKLIKIVAIGALLACSAAASAEFKTVERANEVFLSELELPTSTNGVTSFKACSTCSWQRVRVSAATRYRLNDRFVSLTEFRRALSVVPGKQRESAIVRHHLGSDLVTLISVRL